MVQRYKFESKSQLQRKEPLMVRCCFQWFKDTNLKVNHNFVAAYNKIIDGCFQWFKDTNLKVNHNRCPQYLRTRDVVSNGSKIQI